MEADSTIARINGCTAHLYLVRGRETTRAIG
jgi:hypothetical protein